MDNLLIVYTDIRKIVYWTISAEITQIFNKSMFHMQSLDKIDRFQKTRVEKNDYRWSSDNMLDIQLKFNLRYFNR